MNDHFRDNPSAAELPAQCTPQQEARYKRYTRIGLAGLLLSVVTLICIATGVITHEQDLLVWAVGYLFFSTPVYAVLIVTGISRGMDHRPTIVQMLAAGGRR